MMMGFHVRGREDLGEWLVGRLKAEWRIIEYSTCYVTEFCSWFPLRKMAGGLTVFQQIPIKDSEYHTKRQHSHFVHRFSFVKFPKIILKFVVCHHHVANNSQMKTCSLQP